MARFGIVDSTINPRDEQIAVRRDFDDWEATGVFYFIERTRGRKAAFAIVDGEANVSARLIAFLAGNRPDNVGAVIGSERNLGSVLFSLDGFGAAVHLL